MNYVKAVDGSKNKEYLVDTNWYTDRTNERL